MTHGETKAIFAFLASITNRLWWIAFWLFILAIQQCTVITGVSLK